MRKSGEGWLHIQDEPHTLQVLVIHLTNTAPELGLMVVQAAVGK